MIRKCKVCKKRRWKFWRKTCKACFLGDYVVTLGGRDLGTTDGITISRNNSYEEVRNGRSGDWSLTMTLPWDMVAYFAMGQGDAIGYDLETKQITCLKCSSRLPITDFAEHCKNCKNE